MLKLKKEPLKQERLIILADHKKKFGIKEKLVGLRKKS